jgi:quercetin dioxygenase-like cupin family protein
MYMIVVASHKPSILYTLTIPQRYDMKTNSWEKAPRMTPAPGVEIRIIGSGEKTMLTYIIAQPSAVVPDHKHPHEQIGTCIKGEGVLTSGGKKFKTITGASWQIPGGESHDWVNTSKGETILIETFAPPREDYLAKAK